MPGLRTKRLAVMLVLVGIVGLLTTTCGGGQETNPEKLIPDGSNLIAHVNLTGLLASNGLLSLVTTVTADQENPKSIDDFLEEALAETGVDLRQFSQAVLFTDTGRSGEFTGVIAKGNFDELSLISSIRNASESRLVSAPYNDNLIYSPEDDSDAVSISVLEERILIVGTGEAVRAVIDVQRGDRKKVSGDLVEAFNDLGGGYLRLEAAVPADLLTENLPFFLATFPDLGDLVSPDSILGQTGPLGALEDLELIGLALSQNGQIFILRANIDFATQDSAAAIEGLIKAVLALAVGLIPDPEASELLDKLEVSRNDGRLTIRLEITGQEISSLATSLSSVSQSETGISQAEGRRIPRTELREAIEEPRRVPRIIALGDEFPIMPTSFHVPNGEEVDYSTTPPTSGDHWEGWADCGFYPDGLPDETITHNLEHGNIVVSYNLPLQGQKDRLQSVINNIPISAIMGVTRYYDEIPESQIVLAAWGRTYGIGGIDQESIEAFFSLYAGALGPERILC